MALASGDIASDTASDVGGVGSLACTSAVGAGGRGYHATTSAPIEVSAATVQGSQERPRAVARPLVKERQPKARVSASASPIGRRRYPASAGDGPSSGSGSARGEPPQGLRPGNAFHRFSLEDEGDAIRQGPARKRALAREQFVQHTAKRPHVGAACRPRGRAPARDSCTRPCRGFTPASFTPRPFVGDCVDGGRTSSSVTAFA
jgi:hypothetical protein